MAKYRNIKREYKGIIFDSGLELKRYHELQLLERAGQIKDLRLQVPFELIPKQINSHGKTERTVTYKADFVYIENGSQVVEDTKGIETDVYILKRKLMLHVHGITIKEVRK